MKLLRYALALLTMCALSGMGQAHAFKLGVLDAGPGIDYTGTPLTNLMFGSCGVGTQGTEGCITIENETGALLTSFQLSFSTSNLPLASQNFSNADCSTGTMFASCAVTSLGGDNYSLVLYGGTGVPSDPNAMKKNEDKKESKDADDYKGHTFIIQENGLPLADFANTPLTVTATPEPGSIWLMSTGALMLCAFFYYKRRNGFGDQSL